MKEIINASEILVRKRDGKRPRHRGEESIKIDLKYIGCEDVDWIHLVQDRVQWQTVVNMVMSLIRGKEFLEYLSNY
jgi:hypothetical protein